MGCLLRVANKEEFVFVRGEKLLGQPAADWVLQSTGLCLDPQHERLFPRLPKRKGGKK